MKGTISLFAASVEKVYGWFEDIGFKGDSDSLLGLGEVWSHITGKKKTIVKISELSPIGQKAVKILWKAKATGKIA